MPEMRTSVAACAPTMMGTSPLTVAFGSACTSNSSTARWPPPARTGRASMLALCSDSIRSSSPGSRCETASSITASTVMRADRRISTAASMPMACASGTTACVRLWPCSATCAGSDRLSTAPRTSSVVALSCTPRSLDCQPVAGERPAGAAKAVTAPGPGGMRQPSRAAPRRPRPVTATAAQVSGKTIRRSSPAACSASLSTPPPRDSKVTRTAWSPLSAMAGCAIGTSHNWVTPERTMAPSPCAAFSASAKAFVRGTPLAPPTCGLRTEVEALVKRVGAGARAAAWNSSRAPATATPRFRSRPTTMVASALLRCSLLTVVRIVGGEASVARACACSTARRRGCSRSTGAAASGRRAVGAMSWSTGFMDRPVESGATSGAAERRSSRERVATGPRPPPNTPLATRFSANTPVLPLNTVAAASSESL